MINLEVDEAYAFDYLSILQVKNNLFPSEQKRIAYENCSAFLNKQLQNFDVIIDSKEYQDLYKINKITFDLVDQVRDNEPITAKSVDDANMERFYCKKRLQEKFFDTKLVETKIVKN
jgi:hypothetical protein